VRILSKRVLREFWDKNRDAEQALLIWYKEVSKGKFKSTKELTDVFSSCRPIGSNRYIFNIKGNNYRLVVRISFELGTVWIRFIGNHEAYNKINALKI